MFVDAPVIVLQVEHVLIVHELLHVCFRKAIASTVLTCLRTHGQAMSSIDLYQAVTILAMLPVSVTVINANTHCANMAPDYYFVQPQFGYNELEWSKSRWPHRTKVYVVDELCFCIVNCICIFCR